MPYLDQVSPIYDPIAFDEQTRRRPARAPRPFSLPLADDTLADVPHIVPRMTYVAAGTGAAIVCLSRAVAGSLAEQ